jgi:hypothetical protein
MVLDLLAEDERLERIEFSGQEMLPPLTLYLESKRRVPTGMTKT